MGHATVVFVGGSGPCFWHC